MLVTGVTTAQAQRSPASPGIILEGTVTDTLGRPIAQAYITDVRSTLTTTSDSSGRFRLVGLTTGTAKLLVRRLGFVPATYQVLLSGDAPSAHVSFALTPTAIVLDSVTTVAAPELDAGLETNGFYERAQRRRQGAGSSTLLAPEDIDRRRPLKVSDLLMTIPGVHLRYERNLAIPYGRGANCVMNVWIDGVLVRDLYMFSQRPNGQVTINAASTGLDGYLLAQEILAVEVYPSPSEVPPRFDVIQNQCGTIVLWTK